MPELLRALSHRNYRLYFSGQLFSLAGTWMQRIAMSWLVYRLTGSTLMLGVVSFAGQIPVLVLAPFGGVFSDRYDQRVMLLWTQSLALVQALLLAALTLSGRVQPWHLTLMALSLGIINAIDTPVRQAFVVQLVGNRADLGNAIALNSFTMNAARFIGPSIAGVVVGLAGEGVCFLINAASYLAVILALRAMITGKPEKRAHAPAGEAILQGLRYAFGVPGIRQLLILVAAVSFFVTPYVVLLPYFAREVYAGGAQTFGFLSAAAGAGALLGTLHLASQQGVGGLSRLIGRAALVAGVALAAFAVSRELWLAVTALVVLGFCVISIIASANTLIQAMVKDALRGRVMSLFTMAFLGVAPLGGLAAGWVAEHLGPRTTLLACAAAAIGAAVLFVSKRASYSETVGF